MATGSLFIGIDSSGGTDSAMELFLAETDSYCMKISKWTLRKRERAHERNRACIHKAAVFQTFRFEPDAYKMIFIDIRYFVVHFGAYLTI